MTNIDAGNMRQDKKILIIGLGEIGHTNAEYMTSLGLKPDGFDISDKAITRAISDGLIAKKAESFAGYDYYIICISTHKPENMFMPFLDGMYEVVSRIAKEGKTGALVGIDSTIPRGTTKKIESMLNHRLHVVHVPHRYYGPEKDIHGVNQTRVIGAPNQCCIDEAVKFYGKTLNIPLHMTSSPEIAELTKVVENSYRFLEIAFAEELKIVCDNSNLDFGELRAAINTKWNIKILEAQKGIGGHCLPKDSQMFLDLSNNIIKSSLIEAAKKVDQQYRMHIMQKVAEDLKVIDKPI